MKNLMTENYAHRIAPQVKPSYTTPNLPKADCPIGIIFGKVSEAMRKVSHGLESNRIDTQELGVTRQLSEMFESVEQIAEAYRRFEHSQYLLDRDLGYHSPNQLPASTNNSGRVFSSFEELKKSTETE